jgi:CAAX protease family protein
MLTEKPWKTDAFMRLFLSLIVSYFAGVFVVTAIQHAAGANLWFWVLISASFCCLAATLVLLRKSWRLDDSLARLVLILICFYIGLILGGWASKLAGPVKPSIPQMIISALSLQGAALVLVTFFVRDHEMKYPEAFGLKENVWRAVLLGVVVACIFVPIGRILQDASAHVMVLFHLKPEQQQVVQTLQTSNASAARAVFGLITVFLVPPAEEVFFRGILYPWIKQAGFPRFALWGTSLVFAGVHSNMMSFVPLTVLALALAVLYERTGNLLAPITAHAAFNAANLVRLYLLERALS